MSTPPTRRKTTRRRAQSAGGKPSHDPSLADLLNSAAKGIPKETKKTPRNGSYDGFDNHKNHPTKDTWVSPCEDHSQNLRYFLYIYKCDPCDLRRNCPNKVTCPGWHHEGERRRNPSQFVYSEDPCAHTKGSGSNKWLSPSRCPAGDACQYSHTLLEQMYHPCIYKTSLCINYTHVSGNRCQWGYYCTHAHGRDDIRTPPRRMHPSGSAGAVGMYAYPSPMYASRTRAVSNDSAMPHLTGMPQQHMHGHMGAGMFHHPPQYARFDMPHSPHQTPSTWSSRVGKHATESPQVRAPNARAPAPPPGLGVRVPSNGVVGNGGALGVSLIPKALPRDQQTLNFHSPNKSRDTSPESQSPRSQRHIIPNGSPGSPPQRRGTRRQRSYSEPKQLVPVLKMPNQRPVTAQTDADGIILNWRRPASTTNSSSKPTTPRSTHSQAEERLSASNGGDLASRESVESPLSRRQVALTTSGSSNKLYAGAPPYFPQTAGGSVDDVSPNSSVSGAGMATVIGPKYSAPSPPENPSENPSQPGSLSTGTASALATKIFHRGQDTIKSLMSSLNKKENESGMPRTVTPDVFAPPPTAHPINNPDPTLYVHQADVDAVNASMRRGPLHPPSMVTSSAPRPAVAGWRKDQYLSDLGMGQYMVEQAQAAQAVVQPPQGHFQKQHYPGYQHAGPQRDVRPSSAEFDHLIYELEKERRNVKALQKENTRLNTLVSGDTISQLQRLIVCPHCESSENKRNRVMIPCGHLICEKCDKNVRDVCPMCSSHVTGHVPIQV